MKQLLREVFLPLDLAFRDFGHIRNCVGNEELHRVDDVLQGREKTVSEGGRVPELYSCHYDGVSGQGRHCGPSVSKQHKGVTCPCSAVPCSFSVSEEST